MPAAAWRLAVQEIKRLAVPGGREALGKFSLEGIRSLERALRSGVPIHDVLVSERFHARSDARSRRLLEDCSGAGIALRVAPDAEVDALTEGRGLGDVFATLPLPPEPELASLFSAEDSRQLILVGTETADPGNTGAMIRSALASGALAFVALGRCDPWHPKSVRTSMGSLFKLPVLRTDATRLLEELQALRVETIATVCRDAESLTGFQPGSSRMALFMGCEAFGLPDDLVQGLDRRITIPMPEGVDSFSVNAAAAVLAYTLLSV